MTFKHWQTRCQCGLVMYNKACLKHNWGQMAKSGAKTGRQSICMSTEYQYDCNQESHKCLSDKSFHSAYYFFFKIPQTKFSVPSVVVQQKPSIGTMWQYTVLHINKMLSVCVHESTLLLSAAKWWKSSSRECSKMLVTWLVSSRVFKLEDSRGSAENMRENVCIS